MENNINQYWPIYKRLEQSFEELTYNIHICDEQLDVYSSTIADMLIRIGTEIEAISKAIYIRHFDPNAKAKDIKFDYCAIKKFVGEWKLDQKVVILSHLNCFCKNKQYRPFVKDEQNASNGKMTFSWNNAYQHLKHDREQSFSKGNLRYLLSGMAALFVLNLYYKDEIFDLGADHSANSFDPSLGSSVFSIQISPATAWDGHGNRHQAPDFSEAIYFVDREAEYARNYQEAAAKFNEAYNNEIINTKEAKEAILNVTKEQLADPNWLQKSIPSNVYMKCAQKAQQTAPMLIGEGKYQALINRNQFSDR